VPLPHSQILSAVSPLLRGPDGSHRLTLHLEPEHLGSVRVQIALAGGEVTVQLAASDAATRELLRQSSGELRTQLEQLGLRSSGVDVQAGGPGPQQRDPGADSRPTRQGGPDTRPGHHTQAGAAGIPALRPTSTDRVLDVRM
jgi:flagellar hook-length control protein FliK